MSIESMWCVVVCGVWVVGSVGTSVPAGPRLRGRPRGIGGEATKSKTTGGGATPHACPTEIQLQNTQEKITQKETHKGNKMQKDLKQKTKNTQHKTQFITAALTTLILITGCQTTDPKQKKVMAHVITQQEILIDTLVAERDQQTIKSQIRKSEPLTTAEVHLVAALNALRQSSQALKEVMNNE